MFNDHFGENDKDKGNNEPDNEPDANYAATATIGDWFTTNDNADLEGKPMKVFLKIRNPYDGYSLENLAEEVGGKIKPEDYEAFDEDRDNTSPIIEAGKQFREELESEGYDGIVIEDEEVGGKSYVIFAPNQVKSATKNNGDFSKDNVNIYYRLKDSTFIKSGSYFSGGERASSESMITDKRNVEKRNSATQLTSTLYLDGDVEVLDTNEGLEGKEKRAKGFFKDGSKKRLTSLVGAYNPYKSLLSHSYDLMSIICKSRHKAYSKSYFSLGRVTTDTCRSHS